MNDLLLRRRALLGSRKIIPVAVSYSSNSEMMQTLYEKQVSPRLDYITIEEATNYKGKMYYGADSFFKNGFNGSPYPFVDLRYFTKASYSRNAISAVKICCPAMTISSIIFTPTSDTKTIIIPEGCVVNKNYAFDGSGLSTKPVIDFIIESSNPNVANGNNLVWQVTINKIYVPDDAVSTFKSNSNWSSVSSKIYSITSYTER